ncbi:MAG TPA: hypothetical protein VNM15_00140, partial [Candidatus Binatia bacterium]|nr:hypothetical protein [Candidatus Binatia bacterium]
MGVDHGDQPMHHVIYDEATNTWSLVERIFDFNNDGGAHGYEHLAINYFTGELYYRRYSGFTGSYKINRCAAPCTGTTSWTIPWSTISTAFDQVAVGTGFWSGTLAGATGGVGAYILYGSGAPNGNLFIVNPTNGSLIATVSGFGGNSTYHSFFEYSPVKNVAVFGGGNDNP